MSYLRSSAIYVMPIISWPILLHNTSIIVRSWKDEWYICCRTEAEEFYSTLSAWLCCAKNMNYYLRLHAMHTSSSSRTFQSWTWRSKFKSDLAEICSHSKKFSWSWTVLVELVSVPDDEEHSWRLTRVWRVAVMFIFILTELSDDVGTIPNRRESCSKHKKYSPKGLFRISSLFGWNRFRQNWSERQTDRTA